MATRQAKRKSSAKKKATSFADALEVVDQLSFEEQEELTRIVRLRLAERGRQRVIRDVKQAEAEYAAGKAKVATVQEIMAEILS